MIIKRWHAGDYQAMGYGCGWMFAIAMSICFKHLSSFWLGNVAMAIAMPPMPPLYLLALLPFARERWVTTWVGLVVSRCLSLRRFCSERGWLLRLGLLPWHDSDYHSSVFSFQSLGFTLNLMIWLQLCCHIIPILLMPELMFFNGVIQETTKMKH